MGRLGEVVEEEGHQVKVRRSSSLRSRGGKSWRWLIV